MFQIEFTPESFEDLQLLKPSAQRQIIQTIKRQLQHEPLQPTRNRKKLRPNNIAEWELRIEIFRVFYDVNETLSIVKISAIGYKQGNQLFIHGEEYQL